MSTYDQREASRLEGQPIELYLFQTDTHSFYVTSADEPQEFSGNTYEPLAITRTDFGQGPEAKAGATTVTLPKNHLIALEFVSYIPATPMSLVIYRRHRDDAEEQTIVLFIGAVKSARFADPCELHCEPESAVLQRRIPGPRYQRPCNRVLYALGCDVDREDFKVAATITDVSQNGLRIRAAEFATKPDHWFDAGYIEMGAQRRMVLRHINQELDLILPMPGLGVGSELTAFAGCQRRFQEDCVDKFDNGHRFLGFEWIPTRNPFNGLE